MDVVPDTNVWYYLARGALRRDDVALAAEQLVASPVVIDELLAGLTRSTWSERQAVFRCILQLADRFADHPEDRAVWLWGASHLGSYAGDGPFARIPGEGPLMRLYCVAVAGASDLEELRLGVVDPSTGQHIMVLLSKIVTQHVERYEGFLAAIRGACAAHIPRYSDWLRAGKPPPALPRDRRRAFTTWLDRDARRGLLLTVRDRVRKVIGVEPPADIGHLNAIWPQFRGYVDTYLAYVRDLVLHRHGADRNDFGDLELFLYAQGGSVIATAERKWHRLSREAATDEYVRKVPWPPGPARKKRNAAG